MRLEADGAPILMHDHPESQKDRTTIERALTRFPLKGEVGAHFCDVGIKYDSLKWASHASVSTRTIRWRNHGAVIITYI